MRKAIFNAMTIAPFLVLLASCKNEVVIVPRTDIHLDSNNLVGKYMADKDGKALYYFSNDANGQSNCTGGCLTVWPIFYADSATTTFSADLQASDFKTITTPGGVRQTTYKGWPLYYYAPAGVQEAAGETKGEGVNNIWFVVKNNYSITISNNQLTGLNNINYLGSYAAGNGRTIYFSDEKGNTLYTFTRDSAFKNKSNNNLNFPIYETNNITLPSTLDKSLFTLITVNNKNQLTYKGWPLYYYLADNFVRGSNKGFTFPATQPAGAIWPVAIIDAPLAPRL